MVVILVDVLVMTVAVVPLNLRRLAEGDKPKFVPMMVIGVSVGPQAGTKAEMTGGPKGEGCGVEGGMELSLHEKARQIKKQ